MKSIFSLISLLIISVLSAKATPGPFSLPEGVKAEQWVMWYDGEARFVDVAVVGDKIYLGNLSSFCPKSFVIGQIDGDRVSFPLTYLGENFMEHKSLYFVPATWDTRFIEQINDYHEDYYITDEYVFGYDADKKLLSCIEEYSAIFIGYDDTVGALAPGWVEYFWEPSIRYVNPDAADAPLENPVMLNADFDDVFESYTVEFYLSSANSEGYPLDTDKLYYIFYVDGQPFTFEKDPYWALEEPLTEVPYNFVDWDTYDIYANGDIHYVSLYQEATTVGVKLFYRLNEEITLESEYVEANLQELVENEFGGVANVVASQIVKTEWYDLSGRKVANPGAGLHIRLDIKADGTTKATRVLRR